MTRKEKLIRHSGFIALNAIFLGGIWLLSQHRELPELSFINLLLLSLAAFRVAHTLTYNEIGEPLRSIFTKVEPDDCGAGDGVHPKGNGIMYVIGAWFSCPICTGTWGAEALYAIWALFPAYGRILTYILAIAGGAEMLHWFSEVLTWFGRAGRVYSGEYQRCKNGNGNDKP